MLSDQLYKQFVVISRSTENFEEVSAILTRIIDDMIYENIKYPEAIRFLEHLESLIYGEAEAEESVLALRNYLRALDLIQIHKNKFDSLTLRGIADRWDNKINKP